MPFKSLSALIGLSLLFFLPSSQALLPLPPIPPEECYTNPAFVQNNTSLCCDSSITSPTGGPSTYSELCCRLADPNGTLTHYSTPHCCNCEFHPSLCCSDHAWVASSDAYDVCCPVHDVNIPPMDKMRCCEWFKAGEGPGQDSCYHSTWSNWGTSACLPPIDPPPKCDTTPGGNFELAGCCKDDKTFTQNLCCKPVDFVTIPQSFPAYKCCSSIVGPPDEFCMIDNWFGELIPFDNFNQHDDNISNLHCCLLSTDPNQLLGQTQDEKNLLWGVIGQYCCSALADVLTPQVLIKLGSDYSYLTPLIRQCADKNVTPGSNPCLQ